MVNGEWFMGIGLPITDYRLRKTVNGRFQFSHRLVHRIINQDETIHPGCLQGGAANGRFIHAQQSIL
jgi:hypothetical protein